MYRLIFVAASLMALAFIPLGDARGANSTATSAGSDIHGRIQSVTLTTFSVGVRNGHGRHRRLNGIVVHYDPAVVSMTVDGVAVKILDTSATGKYVSIVGTMKDNLLEATSITVSSSPPAKPKKSKSQG